MLAAMIVEMGPPGTLGANTQKLYIRTVNQTSSMAPADQISIVFFWRTIWRLQGMAIAAYRETLLSEYFPADQIRRIMSSGAPAP
ncbi:hypothetical protein A6D6_00655 [Alcanivorax xiamenensis]|uniref:Uncharacterized protein n=1 Tax=Alcanivorax xiamenensis TaxID=1177156 RepID=A0ABQ6YCJ6_9GAMM|nr:hypothetical protein A6D6_00655 [Alcanivorax xiamenensis]